MAVWNKVIPNIYIVLWFSYLDIATLVRKRYVLGKIGRDSNCWAICRLSIIFSAVCDRYEGSLEGTFLSCAKMESELLSTHHRIPNTFLSLVQCIYSFYISDVCTLLWSVCSITTILIGLNKYRSLLQRGPGPLWFMSFILCVIRHWPQPMHFLYTSETFFWYSWYNTIFAEKSCGNATK